MQTDGLLIEKAKALVQQSLGWGDPAEWTSQDFDELSEKILEKTGVNLSAVTLKRLWGKVKYSSEPSLTTLDTLVRFIDYDNWRDFKLKALQKPVITGKPIEQQQGIPSFPVRPVAKKNNFFNIGVGVLAILGFIYASFSFFSSGPAPDPADYQFSSQTVVSEGLPNSVVFDIDARKSPEDSVTIQQSWDVRLQTRIPKDQRQHTCIYYYPGSFQAKLMVGRKVVKEHQLLIRTAGWLPLIEGSPVPTFLNPDEVISAGKMSVTAGSIRKYQADHSLPANIFFFNVHDFGEIYSDDFVFETLLKNTSTGQAGLCRKTFVFLPCADKMIWIPLSAKGCIADLNLTFTDHVAEGSKTDLSAFGVDFNDFIKLRIESKGGKGTISINERPVYIMERGIVKAKIVGIGFRFQGEGSVDYVKLTNGKVKYEDEFGR